MTPREEYNKIFKKSQGHGWRGDQFGGAHALGGLTVRAWVEVARKGWPKVPVPKDPHAAALKVAAAYGKNGGNAFLDSYEER